MAQFAFGKMPIQLTNGMEIADTLAVAAIRWVNPTAGQSVTVTDKNNKTLCVMTGPASVADVWVPFPLPIEAQGLGIGTIPSGQVWVYLA